MRLTATVTDNTATIMANASNSDDKRKGSGLLTDVRTSASADTSVSVSISDSVGVVYTLASGDYTSATIQNDKNEANTNFKRINIVGNLTVTVSGIGSGNVQVDAFVIYEKGPNG